MQRAMACSQGNPSSYKSACDGNGGAKDISYCCKILLCGISLFIIYWSGPRDPNALRCSLVGRPKHYVDSNACCIYLTVRSCLYCSAASASYSWQAAVSALSSLHSCVVCSLLFRSARWSRERWRPSTSPSTGGPGTSTPLVKSHPRASGTLLHDDILESDSKICERIISIYIQMISTVITYFISQCYYIKLDNTTVRKKGFHCRHFYFYSILLHKTRHRYSPYVRTALGHQ